MADKLLLYYDVNTDNLYNEAGSLYGNNVFSIYFNNKVNLELHYVTETEDADPSNWTKWTSLLGTSVGSTLTFDNNYIHAIKGTVAEAAPVGSTSISVTVSIDANNLNPSDKIIAYKADGTALTYFYSSYSKITGGYTFELTEPSTVALTEGLTVRVPEAMYIKCMGSSVDDSRKDEGIFSFDMYAMSHKILNALDYSGTTAISGTAEHQIKSEGEIIRTTTFPLTIKNLMDYDETVNVPSQEGDYPDKAYVKSFFSAGETYQYSIDGTSWHDTRTDSDTLYRSKLNTPSGVWGEARDLIKGNPGQSFKPDATGTLEDRDDYDDEEKGFAYLVTSGDEQGCIYFKKSDTSADWTDGSKFVPDGLSIQFSEDGSTSWHSYSEYTVKDAYYRFSTDGGETWGSAILFQGHGIYTYVAYASDVLGSDFSNTPSSALPYRAEIHVTSPITTPTAEDFADATWVRYLGDYTYVAYASDDTGSDWSETPSDSLPYRAEIHSEVKIATRTEEDFYSATWVRMNGNKLLVGNTAPTSDTGANGDYYICTVGNTLYKKESGSWSAMGSTGIKPDAVGSLAERAEYDLEDAGFLYFCTDDVELTDGSVVQYMYMKRTSTEADWSEGFYYAGVKQGQQGEQGEPGEDAIPLDPLYFYSSDYSGDKDTPNVTVQSGASGSRSIIITTDEAAGTKYDALVGSLELKQSDGTWLTADHATTAGTENYSVKVNTENEKTYVYLGTSLDISRGGRIRFAQGITTEDGVAAGFGTPTATVTTLEPGNDATVSIEASGEDTAKEFAFTFGIPKGDGLHVDAVDTYDNRYQYDAELKGFTFLATDVASETITTSSGTYTRNSSYDGGSAYGWNNTAITPATVYTTTEDPSVGMNTYTNSSLEVQGDAILGFYGRHQYLYQKKSNTQADWSDPVILYLGRQGIQGIQGETGEKGDKGDKGENADKIEDIVFISAYDPESPATPYLDGNHITFTGTNPVASVDLYTDSEKTQTKSIEQGDSVGNRNCLIVTNYDSSFTTVYFGYGLDTSYGGHIRFAQGIGGKSPYQEYLDAGGTKSYFDWLEELNEVHVQFQFSEDGTDWHEAAEQTEDDAYMRLSSDNGLTWTDAIKFKGEQGEKGANALSVTQPTVTTLVEGSSATATATMNSAGVVTFGFGIPRGATGTQGPKGDPGVSLNFTGEYNNSTVYSKTGSLHDSVTHEGSSWYWINESSGSGHVPPSLPTTSNAYWALLVSKGDQGIQGSTGAAAGFGSTTATATGLGVGATPTVSVTTSGPNTAKNYAFEFGIPAAEVLDGNYVDITTISSDYMVLDDESMPTSVEISGVGYDVPNGIIEHVGSNFKIPVAPFLAQANLSSFSGTWRVWRAGGKKGEATVITIGSNGNWYFDGVDTNKKATGQGSNVVYSPTPPADTYDGLIWIQAPSGTDTQYYNIDPIDVQESSTEPTSPADGTIWIQA